MTEAPHGAIGPGTDRMPEPPGELGLPAGRETVLVVHSYKSLRQAIAHTLRLQGFEVIEAEKPASALGMLQSAAPALLLLEIPLGMGDTVGPAAELARAGGVEGVPVIGLGSRLLSPEEAGPLAIRELVVMPVPQQELIGVVRRTLEWARHDEGGASDDPQWRLPLGDSLRAEHLSLSFIYPDATRIELRPGNDREVRAFRGRLATLGIVPEVEIDRGDLLFRYDATIADALLLDPEGGAEGVRRHLVNAVPSLGLQPEPLRRRLEALAGELRRLQRAAS